MSTCLGKSCSYGLLCVSFVNVYQCVCVCLCGMWNLIVLVPDHCLSLTFLICAESLSWLFKNKSGIYFSCFSNKYTRTMNIVYLKVYLMI